jgi:hypothetical protein
MEPEVIEGTIKEMTWNDKILLIVLEMPRDPEKAKMSFPLDSDYEAYLNKRIRAEFGAKEITIKSID